MYALLCVLDSAYSKTATEIKQISIACHLKTDANMSPYEILYFSKLQNFYSLSGKTSYRQSREVWKPRDWML